MYIYKCEVEKLVRDGHTYEQISGELKRHCPAIQSGLLCRSFRRYCEEHIL